MFDKFITHLQYQLTKTLPGQAAQYKMAHIIRQSYDPAPDNAKNAATLALFYPKNNDIYFVLIERVATNVNDHHKGQISFPGGRYDDTDSSLQYTAIREVEEEVGVPKESIQILGKLTNLYIPISNFLVHPYIGYVTTTPQFIPQIAEVKNIMEVPFRLLQAPNTLQKKEMLFKQMTLKDVPYFNIHDKVVWGATAMILSELLEVIGSKVLRN